MSNEDQALAVQSGEPIEKLIVVRQLPIIEERLKLISDKVKKDTDTALSMPWEDKEGNKRRSAEIVADSVYFGDSKRDGDATAAQQSQQYRAPAAPAGNYSGQQSFAAGGGFSEIEDDGELPF